MQTFGIYLSLLMLVPAPQDNTKPQAADSKTVSVKPEDRTYNAAFAEAQKTQRPLVVVVTATWCPPCRVLKEKVLNPLEAKRGFDNVILAYVDMDKEPEIAQRLVGNQGIPQVIVFEKTQQDKWVKRHLTGFQELATVQEFIKPQQGREISGKDLLRLADNHNTIQR